MLQLLNGGTIFGKFFSVTSDCFKSKKKLSNTLLLSIRLSEGFATLFEYQLTGVLYPEWRTRHFFNIRELHNAFRYDSRDVTRSMTPSPSLVTPAEIRSSFDTIAYDKCKTSHSALCVYLFFKIFVPFSYAAGSVIRMFQNAVGEDIFRTALNLYLTNK